MGPYRKAARPRLRPRARGSADLGLPAHVGPEHVRDLDAAVLALVVLDHGDDEPRQRDAGAVQGVGELHLVRLRAAVADARAPRLEVAERRDGAHLEPRAHARAPELEVVRAPRR